MPNRCTSACRSGRSSAAARRPRPWKPRCSTHDFSTVGPLHRCTPEPLNPLISIVVPVYNEAGTVAEVIQRLIAIDLPAPREILVVNDGSTDGTREVLDLVVERPELRILHAEKNGGKGSAIRIGFGQATGTIVAIQDADLELDPAQIAELVQPILDGRSRVVYGSRFLAGRPEAPWLSVFANQVLTGFTN